MKGDEKAFFTAAAHTAKTAEFLSVLTKGCRRRETLEATSVEVPK